MSGAFVVSGSIPEIINNDKGHYKGDLACYARILLNNAQNIRNPYHNLRHMFHVPYLCYLAICYYAQHHPGMISKIQARQLLIAGFFHDFDHPGIMGHDDLNIERSVRGLDKHILDDDRPYFEVIADLIRPTEFPYTVETDTLSLCGQILRDADMSQALCTAWLQQVMVGLASEWSMLPIQILRMQPGFLRGLKLHTEWAQNMFPQSDIDAKIAEAEALLKIFDISPIE